MKFKAGDRVRVRKWEDMANDFRTVLNRDKSISDAVNKNISFTTYMEKFCNLRATVYEAKSSNEIYLHFDGDTVLEKYRFSEWMLNPLE